MEVPCFTDNLLSSRKAVVELVFLLDSSRLSNNGALSRYPDIKFARPRDIARIVQKRKSSGMSDCFSLARPFHRLIEVLEYKTQDLQCAELR